MNTPLVSVIVPVYKAEKYLHKCVDSLLAQTMTDFEVLLIDDGSPDRSGAICDEYAAKDSRIRVFHKENGGVASARQVGIENVRGEYTIHADPDDWVEPTMLEELYAKAKEDDADMVICDMWIERFKAEEQTYSKKRMSQFNSDSCLVSLFSGISSSSLCDKLIRTAIFKNKINFEKGFNLGEDQLFNFRLFNSNKLKIIYLPKAFYHYIKYVNENSYTETIDFKQRTIYNEKLFSLYRKELKNEILYETVNKYLLYEELYAFFHANNLTAKEFKLKFRGYINVIKNKNDISLFYKWMLMCSCVGGYKVMKFGYDCMRYIYMLTKK